MHTWYYKGMERRLAPVRNQTEGSTVTYTGNYMLDGQAVGAWEVEAGSEEDAVVEAWNTDRKSVV